MRYLALAALLAVGCKDDPKGQTPVDTGADVEPEPDPGPLQAGFARTRIPAPVGMGTVGYGPAPDVDSTSPYAFVYPGTRHVHGHPDLKAVVLSRGGPHELVFVRFDTVGVFQQFRRAVVLEYMERTGEDIDAKLVMGATHTHAGPGRIIDGGAIFDIIADRFFPDFYELFVTTTVDVIEAAYADLQPASLATTVASCVDGHSDRRCADGGPDYTNPAIPLVAVERGGEIDIVMGAYAIHGTGLSLSDLTLSQDVYGAMEQAVEDRFDHPVEALIFNSWGADMSPANPDLESRDGADQGKFDKMERVGVVVADAVHEALDAGLTWQEDPTIRARIYRPPIDREAIGYAEDEFTYEYGGVYCTPDTDCDPATTITWDDVVCIPFNEIYPAPNQTVLTAGEIGDLFLLTFPGEPGTRLAERIMADVRAADSDVQDIFFMGYGQDYLGYSIEEDDWWQGDYEAAGSLWGPRQGEYLADRLVESAGAYRSRGGLGVEVGPIWTFDPGDYTPWEAETPVDPGVVTLDVAASYGRTETIAFSVTGSDPWLGTPTVQLLDSDGAPVLRANGAELSGDDYPFHWTLSVDPSYDDAAYPAERTFSWTVELPAGHRTAAWPQLAAGDYSLEVTVPIASGDTTVSSGPFTIAD